MDYFDWYAAYLHRTFPVADGHRDIVTDVYRRRKNGERGILNRYYKEEFLKSGVNLIFASLFIGADELAECKKGGVFPEGAVLKKGMEMLSAFYADMEETRGRVQLITDRESLLRVTAKRWLSGHHRVGVICYLEGLDVLEGEPELLRCFYAMGVRGAALTWNQRRELPNAFARGCRPEKQTGDKAAETLAGSCAEDEADIITEKGAEACERKTGFPAKINEMTAITGKGVQALFLMEKLGIFIDSSHLSRQAAWLLPSFTKKPYAATHSDAAALVDDERNLTDEEIQEIAKRGGVIGVNAYRRFVQHEPPERPEIEALCTHIVYLLETAGENHVGLGLDLGEGNLLGDYTEIQNVTACLLRRGVSVETVKKVLGGNWIRYIMTILK